MIGYYLIVGACDLEFKHFYDKADIIQSTSPFTSLSCTVLASRIKASSLILAMTGGLASLNFFSSMLTDKTEGLIDTTNVGKSTSGRAPPPACERSAVISTVALLEIDFFNCA